MGFVKKILFGVLALVLLVVLSSFLLPRRIHVERSTIIDATPAAIFAQVDGFRRFNEWSPWYPLDPNATYSWDGPPFGVGAKMSWTGDPARIGSGSHTILEAHPYDRVVASLDFGTQGGATTTWTLSPAGAGGRGTKVVWGFDTDLGFSPASRWFGLMFDSMIGKDYEKGLAGLKAIAERLPKADFSGLEIEHAEVESVLVACAEGSSSRVESEIAAAIGAAYGKVGKFMAAHGLRQAAAPITINRKWDESGYLFDAAIPIDRAPDKDVPSASPVRVAKTWGGKVLKVVHRGAYSGLPATYEGLYAYTAARGLKQASDPWDEFASDPGTTPEADLVTRIYLPVE